VEAAAAALFLVGAIVLWRSAAGAEESEAAAEQEFASRTTRDEHGLRVVATSFAVLFLAEWGDLSQLFTAGLAARTGDPTSVFAGSWLALVTVAGLAVLLGRTLLRFVPLSTVRRVAAGVCLTLALLAAYEVVRGLG
jgi:putative Ca2+/H+ antiporter (TMEM165/GDT1 family)